MRMRLHLLLGALVVDGAAADTNLLANGDFANAVATSGWTCGGLFGGAAWTSDDADALSASGSIELSAYTWYDPYSDSWIEGLAHCDSACFDVRPGAAYSYGGESRLVAVAGAAGSSFAMHFSCGTFAQAACAGTPAWLPGPALSTSPDWTPPTAASGTLGVDAVSAYCQLQTIADGDSASGTAHFDNLFFTTDVVFASGFD